MPAPAPFSVVASSPSLLQQQQQSQQHLQQQGLGVGQPGQPAPQQQQQQALPYPALYLYPLNDSFVPKHIALSHGQHVKIGRQTNAKTAPGERNGYFDSKVLSRQHAEVWEEGGKIYIKDVKSSNGTFINGERLSNEAVESDPWQLKSDDIVEFGIDIVGEDNKTIIHHKVAARVVCVFTEQDAQVAARAEQHQAQAHQQQQQQQYQQQQQQHAGANGAQASGFNFNGTQAQRRPQLQQPSLGGLGGGMRPPGKTGLTFDVILSRLQGELQKSRETGAELNTLTGAMSEIHDTLAGGLPTNLPPYPSVLPPVRPATSPPPPPEQQPPPSTDSALSELQAQLRETQNTLSGQLEKIRALEAVLAEQEAVKAEVRALREMVEVREPRAAFEEDDDDDDARSVSTVVPHELEVVQEEDEEEHEERRRAEEEARDEKEREEMRAGEGEGRPRTPEPNSALRSVSSPTHREPQKESQEEIRSQIVQLTAQVSAVVALTSTLEAQHAAAQSTIKGLEGKVEALEALLRAQIAVQAAAPAPAPAPAPVVEVKEVVEEEQPEEEEKETLTSRITEWMKNVEVKWNSVQEEWNLERERLGKAREEWERKAKAVDAGLERMRASASAGLAVGRVGLNGDVFQSHGLVTPPSPRSQSSDSGRYRRRRGRRGSSASSSASSRGRREREGEGEGETDGEEEAHTSVDGSSLGAVSGASVIASAKAGAEKVGREAEKSAASLVTPESSVYKDEKEDGAAAPVGAEAKGVVAVSDRERNMINIQTAVGVLLLSVAAAAVIWKVKPE